MMAGRCRILLRVCVFLLLGAIVNAGVAWGLALFSPLHDSQDLLTPDAADSAWWQSHLPDGAAAQPLAVFVERDLGCEYRLAIGDRTLNAMLAISNRYRDLRIPSTSIIDCRATVRSGFPWPAVEGDCWQFGRGDGQFPWRSQSIQPTWKPDRHIACISVNGPDWLGRPSFRMLAWRPIWPGFVLNSIALALLMSGVTWLTRLIRRQIRAQRARRRLSCPMCGYPIGTSPICTECGSSLRSKSRASIGSMN